VATTVLGNPTLKHVQWLLDRSRGGGAIVSCYIDKPVAIPPVWSTHLAREVQQAEALLADEKERQHLASNIAVVRTIVSSAAARRARGMAVFVSAARDLIRAFTLDTPVVDRLVVNEEAYVVPLLEYLHRHRRYLVVHTDTHRGRLYTAGRGGLHLIEALDENVPKRHRAGVELWGKQQATIARHREDHILHYRKELVREIERAWAEEPYAGIVLLGEHEVLAHVADELSPQLARHVVYRGPRAWVGRQPRIEAIVEEITANAMREHDQRLADDLRIRLQEAHDIVTGPEEVLNALRSGQVGYSGCVVMEPDRGDTASRCTECGWVFAHLHDTCPFCQNPCNKTNLWQQIALLATGHGIPVHFVGPDSDLQSRGGVAALVTREDPWQSKPAATPGGLAAVHAPDR
jgi:peptide subunit release factor 1 (eRF1)